MIKNEQSLIFQESFHFWEKDQRSLQKKKILKFSPIKFFLPWKWCIQQFENLI